MTRLKPGDIENVAGRLIDYDADLLQKTGLTLKQLSVRVVDMESLLAEEGIQGHWVGIIPMTCGEGRIPGFTETLYAISKHLGFRTFITLATDAAGLAEAVERGADIILTADDSRYVAINLKSGRVIDNSEATGRGFAFALGAMAGGLKGQSVLVVGCGPVGRAAGLYFLENGARVEMYDIQPQIVGEWVQAMASSGWTRAHVADNLNESLSRHRFILDATPAANIIEESYIKPDTMFSMPGIPCGITPASLERHLERVVHDPLQIGTAVMLTMAL